MVFAISYGFGACAFLALITLMLINRRPKAIGRYVLFVCVITLIWAAAAAAQPWWMPGLAHAAESLSAAGWVILLVYILMTAQEEGLDRGPLRILVAGSTLVAAAAFANDFRFLQTAEPSFAFAPSQIFARIAVAVCGLLLTENLFRNISPARRWHVYPFCIAIGFLFAFNLFVFCEAVVLKGVDPMLLAGRGVVLVLIVPLLALTMARNAEWQIDLHVSRKVVFHGATLTSAGIFLLVAAGVGGLIGQLPGEWAAISKISFFSGSVILLLIVLSTGSFRARIRRLIAENFFSARYDYRLEWLRSISTLSGTEDALPVRAVRAIADVVDSPGGILYLDNENGSYAAVQAIGLSVDQSAPGMPVVGTFGAAFQNGKTVQCLADMDPKLTVPQCLRGFWLAVPLTKSGSVVGFVALAQPRAPVKLDWESVDLLLAIGQQVAAFLVEEAATRKLAESQALIEYSKRFSFVVHDVKNVAGQLGMMVANVQRFGDLPEFRADMVRSIENSVAKLNGLLARLRPNSGEREPARRTEAVSVLREIAAEVARAEIPVRMHSVIPVAWVYIAPSALRSMLIHVVTNGLEASSDGKAVTIEVNRRAGAIVIDIVDEGCGMSAEFVRDGLFVPTRTTKANGHGIGAFQARELARAAGGDIQVSSCVGSGTRVSITLPDCGELVTDLPRSRAAV